VTLSPEDLRARYRPAEVRVLFVGESPPVGGTFFYAANSRLYFATKQAFEAAVPDLVSEPFLASFRELGCYLDDLCLVPVNHLKLNVGAQRRERVRFRQEGEGPLAERIGVMNPSVVVLVMSGIQENVRRAAIAAGIGAPFVVLPFPGRPEHSARFDRDLRSALIDLRDRQILRRTTG
jgi:hypothetical protein